ncbi:uncharacterized protein LOC129583030 [Paramacrobiotus metropolitanus]|uniref:uncharacterized protein LOC129583030 n=1 Tax=Paramacrobiotus metropolitanus TaxID=2943436 RepID=UPI0024465B55|nr:uncharacterized protein LOC129583030 [Paramacrobiotus metropolitanus]
MDPVLCVEFGAFFIKAAVISSSGPRRITDSSGSADIPAFIHYDNKSVANQPPNIWVTFGTDALNKYIDNPKGCLMFPKIFLGKYVQECDTIKSGLHLAGWKFTTGTSDVVRVVRDMLTEIKHLANAQTRMKITTLYVALSSYPNPSVDKVFVSAAKMGHFRSVRVIPLAPTLPPIMQKIIDLKTDLVIVHLDSTSIEISVMRFNGKHSTIVYKNVVPIGIVDFLKVVLKWCLEKLGNLQNQQCLIERVRWHCVQIVMKFLYTEETSYRMHINKQTTRNYSSNKSAKDFNLQIERHEIRYHWRKAYVKQLEYLNAILLDYSITTKKVMFSPRSLAQFLINRKVSRAFDSAHHCEEEYFERLCQCVDQPEIGLSTQPFGAEEVDYIVPVAIDESYNTTPNWSFSVKTESDLVESAKIPMGKSITTFEPICSFQQVSPHQAGHISSLQFLTPNFICVSGLCIICDVYAVNKSLEARKVWTEHFSESDGVEQCLPNLPTNMLLIADSNGIRIGGKFSDLPNGIVRKGQFAKWFQWISDDCLAYALDSHIIFLDIKEDCDVLMPYPISQRSPVWQYATACKKNASNVSGMIRDVLEKIKLLADAPIAEDILLSALVDNTVESDLITINKTGVASEYYIITRYALLAAGDVQDRTVWVEVITLEGEDEPLALHSLSLCGLLIVLTRRSVLLFTASNGRLLHTSRVSNGVLERYLNSGISDRGGNGVHQTLLIADTNKQIYALRIAAADLCQSALEIDDSYTALKTSVAFQLTITSSLLLQALPDVVDAQDFHLLSTAMDIVPKSCMEVLQVLLQYYHKIVDWERVLQPSLMRHVDCEALLDMLAKFKCASGVQIVISLFCASDIRVISVDKMLQRCFTLANSFNLMDLMHKILQKMCTINPKLIELQFLDNLPADHALFVECQSRDLLYESLVQALLKQNADDHLISLINQSDHIVLLLRALIGATVDREFQLLQQIIPRTNEDLNVHIAELLLSMERWPTLFEWLQKVQAIQEMDPDFSTRVTVSLVNSENGRCYFAQFSKHLSDVFLEDVISTVVSQSVPVPSDFWRAIIHNCIERNLLVNAIRVIARFPSSSISFGEHLLQTLPEYAEDIVAWPIIVEYFYAFPDGPLRERALTYLERKAPDAFAFAHSQRRQSDRDTGNGTCNICCDAAWDCVFIPCGHVTCFQCAQSLDVCPQCREPISFKQKIFLP